MIVVGATVTDATFSGVTVNVPSPVSPFNDPVIVADTDVPTTLVVIGKVARDFPAGTMTDAGTTTFGLLLVSATVVAVATTSVKLTVPTEATPPTTGAGFATMFATVRILTARVPLTDVPLAVAATSTLRVAVTTVVAAVNVANVLPDGTSTVAGTVTAGFDETNFTEIPVDGAGPVRVTVPIDALPPRTAAGAKVTDAGRAA
jgi:hypothetical protein